MIYVYIDNSDEIDRCLKRRSYIYVGFGRLIAFLEYPNENSIVWEMTVTVSRFLRQLLRGRDFPVEGVPNLYVYDTYR
jgi:hypothetical protein